MKDQEVATTFSFLNEDKVIDAVNSNEEPSEMLNHWILLAAFMIITGGLV